VLYCRHGLFRRTISAHSAANEGEGLNGLRQPTRATGHAAGRISDGRALRARLRDLLAGVIRSRASDAQAPRRSTLVQRPPDEWAEMPLARRCPTCARLRQQIDALGRLRFELQKQVNLGEARARAAEARVAELEDQVRRAKKTSHPSVS
jgi:hypothetical protein